MLCYYSKNNTLFYFTVQQLPLCEMETEKSQLEDILLRSMMQNALAKKMDKKGADMEDYRFKADKDMKENLMKLFAICCKGDKDFRASEYVTMMPSTHSIQVSIKYANKLRKMALTDRLTVIGRKKLDEEEDGVEEDDDDFENMRSGNVIYSSVYSTLANPGTPQQANSSSMLCSSTGGNSFANDSSCDVVFYEGKFDIFFVESIFESN
jgi:chromosome transmission fidelity protein 4